SLSALSSSSDRCRASACHPARVQSFPANWPSLTRGKGEGKRGKLEGGRGKEGHEGWDEYAPFYDWENARTFGRRDVPFWRRLASSADGRVLELGCGTGRVSLPLARSGVRLVGVDRSAAMLARAGRRAHSLRQSRTRM